MGYHFYLCVASIGLVWLVWAALTLRSREAALMAREVDERLRRSTDLLNTVHGSLGVGRSRAEQAASPFSGA